MSLPPSLTATARYSSVCSSRRAELSALKNSLVNASTATRLPEALSRLNPFEQQVLGVGRQVRQQPLRRPRRRNRRVETGLCQRCRPVKTQIDAHG